MAKTKFSIIVPIYNAEKFIHISLDSLINQTYKNIEIICINDGSIDNSLKIVQNYANIDNRIVIINQKNKGVSTARNEGIKKATGDYILFCDADDSLELNSCEILSNYITEYKPDITLFNAVWHNSKNPEKTRLINFEKLIKQHVSFPISCELFSNINYIFENISCWAFWDKCYKKDFLIKNQILFKTNMTQAEDSIFALDVFLCNPKIILINETLYNYNYQINENCATSLEKYKFLDKLILYKKNILGKILHNTQEKEIQNYFYNVFIRKFLEFSNAFYKTKYHQNYINIAKQTIKDFDENNFQIKPKEYKILKRICFFFEKKIYFIYKLIFNDFNYSIWKYCVKIPYKIIKNFLEKNEK